MNLAELAPNGGCTGQTAEELRRENAQLNARLSLIEGYLHRQREEHEAYRVRVDAWREEVSDWMVQYHQEIQLLGTVLLAFGGAAQRVVSQEPGAPPVWTSAP